MPTAQKDFSFLNMPHVLLAKATEKSAVPIHIVREKKFESWLKKQPDALQNSLRRQGWTAKENSIAIDYAEDGAVLGLYLGAGEKIRPYTLSYAADYAAKNLKSCNEFVIASATDLKEDDANMAATGWAMAAYQFDAYKKSQEKPYLVWPTHANKARVEALVQSISLIRNLINLPPNMLGPQELAKAAQEVGKAFGADTEVTHDQDLLTYNFPLVYAVGDGSERRPALVDLTWGNPKHPLVTLVGKGVVFDTGGYDLKPSAAMLLMKKDMGGAALALGVAWMVMSLKLPIRLRVIIPCVENSVSGRAFRPSDIFRSRQGLTVEIGNTDAEGRLILADCLTLASEEKPALLIDFATLTGAARVALGLEIPALFSNNDSLARELQKIALQVDDPLWHMPLWDGYRKDVTSPNADLVNSSNNPAGAITAALFLQHFVSTDSDWIHIDHYGWELSGRPGRSSGGSDMVLRAILALLEQKFSKKKK